MTVEAPGNAVANGGGGRRFALPGKLIVGIAFMLQFIAVLAIGGGVVPELYGRGVNPVLLTLGALLALALLQLVLGVLLKLLPVRCMGCRGQSRFMGFGWWPFIYRFRCRACGLVRRLEVLG